MFPLRIKGIVLSLQTWFCEELGQVKRFHKDSATQSERGYQWKATYYLGFLFVYLFVCFKGSYEKKLSQ